MAMDRDSTLDCFEYADHSVRDGCFCSLCRLLDRSPHHAEPLKSKGDLLAQDSDRSTAKHECGSRCSCFGVLELRFTWWFG